MFFVKLSGICHISKVVISATYTSAK